MADEDPIMEISSAVMTGVEATLEDFATALEEKLGKLMDKIEDLSKAVEAIEKTKDGRSDEDKKEQLSVEDELAADLALDEAVEPNAEPVPPMLQPKVASEQPKPVTLYNLICGKM
jgi:predicted DNA-binding protein